MNQYLIFHLYGPMASFGDTAVGEYRPTFGHPSKSTVLGLVAGALGIRRDDEERLKALNHGAGYAVLVLSHGSQLRDYHTTQVPPAVSVKRNPVHTRRDELSHQNLNTILSARDYRLDGLYRVAIWVKGDGVDLVSIESALRQPTFMPYLGRKSCPPALPFDPRLVQASSVQEALLKTTHSMAKSLTVLMAKSATISGVNRKFRLFKEREANLEEEGQFQIQWRKDRLISRRNWQYGDRQEILISVEGNHVLFEQD